MKRFVFRITSLLLVLGLALASLPATAESAETLRNAEGYVYVLTEDGGAEITGYTGSEKKLVIPSQLDGHTVVSLGRKAFYQLDKITQVEVPDTVRSIGYQCFSWCKSLQTVILPEGLEEISFCAFEYCQKLTKVNIPDSVTKVGDEPFTGCKQLKSVTVSPDHPLLSVVDGVLFNHVDSVLLWYPASKGGKEYTVPEGTKRIGMQAFNESNLEKINVPDSVEDLSSGAFVGCGKLKTVNIPPRVTNLNGVFRFCDRLESINVDEGNEIFESFDGVLFDKTTHTLIKYPAAKKGKTYTIPEGTEIIGDNAFEEADLAEIIIPDSVRVIGQNAFLYCDKLKEIVIPEGTEEFGSYVFQYCTSLTKAVLPASLKIVSSNPFLECTKMTEIVLADDHPALLLINGCLVQKEGMVLSCCPAGIKAKQLEFPAGIRMVDANAFRNCANIEEVVFGDGLETLGSRAFALCRKLKRVVLPASVNEIDRGAFDLDSVKNTVFVVAPGSYAENFFTSYGLKIEYAE